MREYTTKDVAELLGVSVSQIRGYARAGFLSPERGRRSEYRFTFHDIVLLRTAKALADAQIQPRRICRALRKLKGQLPNGQPLTAVRITAAGDQIVVRDKETSWDPDTGQVTFDFRSAISPRRPHR